MADNRGYVAAPAKRLAASISATATTIDLTDVNGNDGTALTMADFGSAVGYATLEPKSGSKIELISFTGISGTSLTGVTRGLKFEPDYTADSNLRKTHAAGATLIFSNSPQFYDGFANKNNEETISQPWTFAVSGGRPKLDTDTDTAVDEEFVSFGQLARQAISGAADATETVAGLVEKATSSETQAGTDSGTLAELFAAPSDIAANTQNQQHVYAADTGAADAYAIALTPAITAYAAGQRFCFLATNVNTGASTLDVNSLGTKTILKLNDQALEAGDIEAGQIVDVVYNGTAFEMQTPIATNLTSAQASEIAAIVDATDVSGAELETLTNGSDASGLHYLSRYENIRQNLAANKYTFEFCLNDGMTESTAGSGQVNRKPLSTQFWSQTTGDDAGLTLGNDAIADDLSDATSLTFADNFNANFVGAFSFTAATSQDAFIGFYDVSGGALAAAPANATLTVDHAAFMIEDGTIYASVADGTTQERTDVSSGITLTDVNLYEIEVNGTTSAVFKINGSTVATLSTNPPNSGAASFNIFITGQTASDRVMHMLHPAMLETTNLQTT